MDKREAGWPILEALDVRPARVPLETSIDEPRRRFRKIRRPPPRSLRSRRSPSPWRREGPLRGSPWRREGPLRGGCALDEEFETAVNAIVQKAMEDVVNSVVGTPDDAVICPPLPFFSTFEKFIGGDFEKLELDQTCQI